MGKNRVRGTVSCRAWSDTNLGWVAGWFPNIVKARWSLQIYMGKLRKRGGDQIQDKLIQVKKQNKNKSKRK